MAKFDCPAHEFLYPNDEKEEVEEEDQRIMVLSHSKHYKAWQIMMQTW